MATEPRLLGTDVSIRLIRDGAQVASINAVGSFNDEVKLEMKQDGFLGEPVDRFDTIHHGYGGDLEFQVNRHTWQTDFLASIEARARREVFTTFNLVRTDRYSNGQSAISTYKNVAWGPVPTNVPSRADYVKVKLSFGCSERPTQVV
jgi:hypothetical protein